MPISNRIGTAEKIKRENIVTLLCVYIPKMKLVWQVLQYYYHCNNVINLCSHKCPILSEFFLLLYLTLQL